MIFERIIDTYIGRCSRFFRRPGLLHGISTRTGGFSTGSFRGMNLGPDTADKQTFVSQNRERFFSLMHVPPSFLAVPGQVHGSSVEAVSKAGRYAGVDGLITAVPGVCLSVLTADCAPVFLYDPRRKVIGLVHSGWRGASEMISTRAVELMSTVYGSHPENIEACVGPAIGPCCYQTGEDMRRIFQPRFFHGDYLDLPAVIQNELIAAGLSGANISISGVCTSCLDMLFFSHRRQGGEAGRHMSVFCLRR